MPKPASDQLVNINRENVYDNLTLIGLKLQMLLLVINSYSKKIKGTNTINVDPFDAK